MMDGEPPAQGESETDQRLALLHRISDALSLPVSAFRRDAARDVNEGPTTAECAAILDAFSRIRDPALRASCLRMVEACAAR